MKPTVPDDGALQSQIGTAYDVVKSVADNLPAILAVTAAVENAQEVIADITEQVELATTAANNATQVVGVIEGYKTASESARDLAEDYRDAALVAKQDAESAQSVITPLMTDFNSKWPVFTANYNDTVSKYNSIVGMHDDVDADRIAAETARIKAEAWANTAVDVVVEAGKYSGMHWATKASGFNTLAQGYAGTATQKAGEANQSAIDANSAAGIAGGHATTATNKAVDADNAAGVALGHANTALGYKNQAWTYREEARGYAEDAAAIVGGDFVPRTTTINGLALSGNITLTAAQLTDLVPSIRTINSKPLTSNVVLNAGDVQARESTWVPTFADVTGKPTTLAGYNINDAQPLSSLLTTFNTNVAAAGSGVFKKTAANTWSFATLVAGDIPSLATTIITSGTFTVARGGTGVATITGLVKGNGTSAFSAAVPGTDYVVPSGSITGNAATATKLAAIVQINGVNFDGSGSITIPAPGSVATADALTTARAITATGDADWSVSFKGDAPVTAALTLKDVATAGTGIKVTYNAKGLVTGSSGLLASDIPNLDWAKITTGVPSFALQSDARFTDSREWTATTAVLADITGANATRKAYTGAVIKAAIDDIAAPKTSTNDRITALESAPDSALIAKKALALAIIGL